MKILSEIYTVPMRKKPEISLSNQWRDCARGWDEKGAAPYIFEGDQLLDSDFAP